MTKHAQTLTPPGHPILADRQGNRCSPTIAMQGPRQGFSGKKRLFSADNHRCDLVDGYPELAEVCDRIGFGEHLNLGEWSESPQWALLELARAAFPPPPALGSDLSSADLSELIDDLIEGHHRPLRNELQRIGLLIGHWSARGASVAHLALAKRYQEFSTHLVAHLDHEELVVFPECLAIDRASRLPRGSAAMTHEVTPAIRAMNVGHEETEQSLQQMRKLFDHLTRGHLDPDVAIIRIGLSEMAADLSVHATKESEFLIPAAIFAEDQVRARNGLI